MHVLSIRNLSGLMILLAMSLLIACGDENGESNANPVDILPEQSGNEGNVDPSTGNTPDNQPEISEDPESEDDGIETAPEVDRGPAELFGAALSDDVEFVPFEDLLSDPEAYADRLIQTEGTIRGVCQRRGCWMELRETTDPSGETVNVRFLDYGFFVPLDARGALVRIEGRAAVQTLSAEEVEELLAEGYDPGIVQEDGTAILIRFTASGVLMWNRFD